VSLRRLRALRVTAIASLLVEIGIYMAMAPDHLAEKFYIGVLFVIGTGFLCLVVLGLAVAGQHRPWCWILGIAVSVVMFALFIASRTIGLPLGYLEGWFTDYALGIPCLVFEGVFVACALPSLRFRRTPLRPARLAYLVRDRETETAAA
jgi:hypothetical protein